MESKLAQQENGADLHIKVVWKSWALCVFQSDLFLLSAQFNQAKRDVALSWDTRTVPSLSGDYFGQLQFHPVSKLQDFPIFEVRFRNGGERILSASGHHVKIKNILHKHRIPPWMRDRVPLLYSDDELMAVGNLMYHPKLSELQGEHQLELKWLPPLTVKNSVDK